MISYRKYSLFHIWTLSNQIAIANRLPEKLKPRPPPSRIEDYLKEKGELTTNTGLNLRELRLSTWNDNAPLTLPGTTAGDDSGKTFDIKLGATFAKNNREYIADAQLTHYTDGEITSRNSNGTIQW